MIQGQKIPGPIEMFQTFTKTAAFQTKRKSEKENQMVFAIYLSFVTR